MAKYGDFDTKRKIKRHPEIGCILHLGGCKTRKVKREGIVPINRGFRWKMRSFLRGFWLSMISSVRRPVSLMAESYPVSAAKGANCAA